MLLSEFLDLRNENFGEILFGLCLIRILELSCFLFCFGLARFWILSSLMFARFFSFEVDLGDWNWNGTLAAGEVSKCRLVFIDGLFFSLFESGLMIAFGIFSGPATKFFFLFQVKTRSFTGSSLALLRCMLI